MQYVRHLSDVPSMYSEEANKKLRNVSYGGVIYMPPKDKVKVDFGPEAWPAQFKKTEVCPRVLLVSNWTDGRYDSS